MTLVFDAEVVLRYLIFLRHHASFAILPEHSIDTTNTFLADLEFFQKTSSMAPPNNRESILASLRAQIDNGKIIVGAGAGIGLSAKFIEQGGGDLIIIYNSGRYRMAGRGSLAGLMPYGNANDVVVEMVSFQSVL